MINKYHCGHKSEATCLIFPNVRLRIARWFSFSELFAYHGKLLSTTASRDLMKYFAAALF